MKHLKTSMFASVADMRNDGKSKNERTESLKDTKHIKLRLQLSVQHIIPMVKITMSHSVATPAAAAAAAALAWPVKHSLLSVCMIFIFPHKRGEVSKFNLNFLKS